ncbi:hypothetical protein [Bradyrhizobium sp. RDM4]|uniref:hypothetical protein n=1 Tax=Bradyrhizobium sp. RDM4 TaxID=3378765 RepID=UPI0038FC7041
MRAGRLAVDVTAGAGEFFLGLAAVLALQALEPLALERFLKLVDRRWRRSRRWRGRRGRRRLGEREIRVLSAGEPPSLVDRPLPTRWPMSSFRRSCSSARATSIFAPRPSPTSAERSIWPAEIHCDTRAAETLFSRA